MGEEKKKKRNKEKADPEEPSASASKKEKKKKSKKCKDKKSEKVKEQDVPPPVETAEEEESVEKQEDEGGIKRKKDKKTATEKEDRKRKRDGKKQRKKEILEQIPKRDKDGISYTKQQIRRMVKRVERGLPPVPTPQEEAELKRQDSELRKEEELELAGMMYKRKEADNDGSDDDNDEIDGEEDGPEEEDDEPARAKKKDGDSGDDEEEEEDDDQEDESPASEKGKSTESQPSKKRKLSKKPVPPDYVCQACKNKHDFPHFIYDCPDKVTVRGTNQVSAGRRHKGGSIPNSKKVFVSGLFYDTKIGDLRVMFKDCGKVTSARFLKFPDSQRCTGQAFVAFDSEDGAKKALKMSGTKISADNVHRKKNTKSSKEGKAELELRVSKVKSRSNTKAGK